MSGLTLTLPTSLRVPSTTCAADAPTALLRGHCHCHGYRPGAPPASSARWPSAGVAGERRGYDAPLGYVRTTGIRPPRPIRDRGGRGRRPGFPCQPVPVFRDHGARSRRERTVSVVRVRELADRVGEPATIVEGLPTGRVGNPVIAAGPDRHVYVAIPSGSADEGVSYKGHVLRFTRDGGAAGSARIGTPILARGRAQPTRLVWDAASRLLIVSAEQGNSPTLSVLSIGAGSEWPGAVVGVGRTGGDPETRLHDVAAAPSAETPVTGPALLAMIAGNPEVISLATLSLTRPPEIASKSEVPLGSLRPSALAFASNGDLLVAAARDRGVSGTILLRLRRI